MYSLVILPAGPCQSVPSGCDTVTTTRDFNSAPRSGAADAAWYKPVLAPRQAFAGRRLAPHGRETHVKFKMARNSLFAVLLRSPWWISFALVLAFAGASVALLPPEYVPFGVMGGFPFLVIGTIAAWRQLRAPSEAQVQATLEQLAAMSWATFAQTLERAFQAQGYTVQHAPTDGADLQLVKDGRRTLVGAKRWKAVNQGVDAVRPIRDEIDLRVRALLAELVGS